MTKVWGHGTGGRYVMAFDLLLRKTILGRLVPAVRPELYSGHKAYRKVLKHKQIELLQF